MYRVLRVNKRIPMSASSLRTAWLIALGDSDNSLAALLKDPVLAAASNAFRSDSGMASNMRFPCIEEFHSSIIADISFVEFAVASYPCLPIEQRRPRFITGT